MNRFINMLLAILAILVLSPLFLLISIFILLDSKGGIIYSQWRVGKNNRDFKILKFRSMFKHSDNLGLITTGNADKRITKTGTFLRKYKLDELPQLFNILLGEMNFVGPRPEVRKYVNLYNADQMKVLRVRPGLTDYASLQYISEGELLEGSENPEKLYIEEIMPAKLKLNLKYIDERSLKTDFRIIFKTAGRIIRGS